MHVYEQRIEAARGDADALYRIATELHGVVRVLQETLANAVRAPKAQRARGGTPTVSGDGEVDARVPRATWLTPIIEVWDKEMGGVFPMGPALKPFAQLRKKGHTEFEIAKRLGYYLRGMQRRNETQFVNVVKFAQQFKLYDPDEIAFPEDG